MTQVNAPDAVRQIVLDTETTGMCRGSLPHQGHKIIEIGAVEIVNRRLTGNHFHVYLNPKQKIEEGAFTVHGIRDEFLVDKPVFADIANDLVSFIEHAELIIHNAAFDIGFLKQELSFIKHPFCIEKQCRITDTLAIARRLFPGKRNNLNVLCERFHIDNSCRSLHGALLDAELLAEIYLAMTGGQTMLAFGYNENVRKTMATEESAPNRVNNSLRLIKANEDELVLHEKMLDKINEKSGHVLWRNNNDQ